MTPVHQLEARRNGAALPDATGPAAPPAAAPTPPVPAREARDERTENPYLAARREWNERYGSYIKQRDAWRRAAVVSWGITALAVASLGWVAAQNRIVPYIVAVDRLGTPTAVGPAEAAAPDARIVRAELGAWIGAVRGVSPDAAAERAGLTKAYALLDQRSSAFATVNDYMRANNPFERARRETVAVEVASVLPLAGDTWRVEWREVVRGRDGAVASIRQWQAAITIAITPPRDERTVLLNPIGIYINALDWSERL